MDEPYVAENLLQLGVPLKSKRRLPKNVTSQPQKTLSGYPIIPYTMGLPKVIESICPECSKVIPALQYEKDGQVWADKECPEHGKFTDLIYGDAKLYVKMEEMTFGDGVGVSNPNTYAETLCPHDCGLCNRHTSHTALGIIDLTNRCDMNCPVCFANANSAGYLYEMTLEQVRKMLQTFLNMRPVPCRFVQFSGGEPTIHPQFLEIVRMAKEMGFTQIQVATNGKRLSDPDFCKAAADAGVDTIYFQFDGTYDDVYQKTRGEHIWEIKQRVVENARKTRMKFVLVPTIVKGINDHQVGDIVRFAIKNVDVITGIAFQPVTFTGRINQGERLAKRYTLADLAKDVEVQTGIAKADADWLPLACIHPLARLKAALSGDPTMHVTCHSACSIGTYIFIDPDGVAHPITRFFNFEGFLKDVDELSRKVSRGPIKLLSKAKVLLALHRHFDSSKAPRGLTFDRMLMSAMDGYQDRRLSRDDKEHKRLEYPNMFIAGMHFQDGYNYNVERVRRCVIHYAAPDGNIYPFCTYNSGPTFRNRIESQFRLSKGEVLKLCEREGNPPELRRLKRLIEGGHPSCDLISDIPAAGK